ncbi:lck-interacting transmembrane adapter 1 isoform X2 [Ascaphus truei]|uniref:lck-interacting transmembrane adapter 1 isoform X2 n=1 Tax=Ascaphus truei TaxID=8439 RepID=UPI003F59B9C0
MTALKLFSRSCPYASRSCAERRCRTHDPTVLRCAGAPAAALQPLHALQETEKGLKGQQPSCSIPSSPLQPPTSSTANCREWYSLFETAEEWPMCETAEEWRKRKRRNVCPSGVALVDVSLLRQTQLRSLSKSDTKLHEIQRPRLGDYHLRPVSMDPMYPLLSTVLPTRHLPYVPPDSDITYSNLTYPQKPPPSTLYVSVGSRGELRLSAAPSPAVPVTAEYACVRKVKKGPREEEKNPPPAPDPCTVSNPAGIRVEDMYSKVNKKKRQTGTVGAWGATEGSQEPPYKNTLHPPRGPPATQSEENLYESICEMNSGVPEADSWEDGMTTGL